MTNVLEKHAAESFRALALFASEQANQDIHADVRLPIMYGLAGVRVLLPIHSRVRPYGTGGVGWGSVRPEIRFRVEVRSTQPGPGPTETYEQVDITSELIEKNYINASVVHTERLNRLLLAGGGGLNIRFPQLDRVEGVLDVGYRYLTMQNSSVPVHRLYIALGVGY